MLYSFGDFGGCLRFTSKWLLQEKTELEEQRQLLAKEVQSYRSKILQLEEDLLFRLSNSQVLIYAWLPVFGLCGLDPRLPTYQSCFAKVSS